MKSYNIHGTINLEALDKYLSFNYPVKILSSGKNILDLKIFGFYRLFPFEPFLFNEAVLSIKHKEDLGLTTVTFSLLSNYFWFYLLFVPLIASCLIASECNPANYFEFALFFLIIFPFLLLPGILIALIKHKRLVSILKRKL